MKQTIVVFALFGILLAAYAGGDSKPKGTTSATKVNTASAAKASPAEVPLKINNFTCERKHGYAIVEGAVKNVSGESIDNLMVVASLQKGDTFIKAATGMVEYQPLLPGQTSPFKAMTSDNPAMTSCSVAFKTMFGGTVPSKR